MTARILVVDDEPDVEALVVQRFRRDIRDGALAFSFAADGVQALEAIAATPDIDVVVSDINMPRMDGLTLLARLGEIEDGPATMIVSAYGDMANIRTAMNRGAFDFVTKPIDFADFDVTLRKTLRHVSELRQARQRALAAERAHAALARYFSPRLASRLAAGGAGRDGLLGRHCEVTVMFSDIAGFTSLAQSLAIETLTELLSEYLGGMIDIVFAHEGTVAKIIGDALQVLFGAPDEQADRNLRAVSCARAMDAFAQAMRARWLANGVPLGITRIGVHCGPAVVGNFGGDRFIDYTAYGDTVNTAARLEAANKHLGTRVCISADVAAAVAGTEIRPVGDLVLRGRSEALRACTLADPDSDDAAFAAAFALLEQSDPRAVSALAAIVARRSEDVLANFFLRRLLNNVPGVRVDVP